MKKEDIIELAREAGATDLVSSLTHPKGPTTALRFGYDNGSLERFADLIISHKLDEIADKLQQDFKQSFGADTCASWASWLRSQK